MRHFASIATAIAVFAAISVAPVQAADLSCEDWCYGKDDGGPIVRDITRRIVTDRGGYAVVREPSLYGWVERQVLVRGWRGEPEYVEKKERVLLRPYKNIALYDEESGRYVTERVVIYPEQSAGESFHHRRSQKDW